MPRFLSYAALALMTLSESGYARRIRVVPAHPEIYDIAGYCEAGEYYVCPYGAVNHFSNHPCQCASVIRRERPFQQQAETPPPPAKTAEQPPPPEPTPQEIPIP